MDINKIVHVFQINHDGSIVKIEEESEDILNIDVEIQYLAEIIDKKFNIFRYKLFGYSKLFLNCCIDKSSDKSYYNTKEIENMGLTILTAEKNDNVIVITVTSVLSEDCIFGQLHIQAEDIIIYDQENNKIEYEKLKEISKNYWKNL